MRQSMDGSWRIAAGLAVGFAALWATNSARAGSISFSGTTTAVFTDPLGGTSSGAGTNSLSFGTPAGALSFTGGSFTATPGQIFALGSIGFYNAENVNPVDAVNLTMTLDMSGGATGSVPGKLALTLENTPKAGVPDVLGLKPNSEIGSFTGSDGQTYSLLAVGFSPPCDGTAMVYTPTFSVNEGQAASTSIYGELVPQAGVPSGGTPPPGGGTPPPSTPEPAGLVLIGIGLATVGLRRYKK